ncbi:MAG: circadian clock KaiB family protein [Candidatus Omnitrophota bacterium]
MKSSRRKPSKEKQYILKLFVAGMSPLSVHAIHNIRKICETHLKGVYSLDVVDVNRKPVLAFGEQIVAAPTLIKKMPLPLRRLIGDMSETRQVLLGLDLPAGVLPMSHEA